MALTTTPPAEFADVPAYDHPHERVTVNDDGAEMAYVDVSTGEETFVLLHGEPTWGFLYRKLVPILAEHGRVLVPDLLGFGRSDKYTDPGEYSFDLLYDGLERWLETVEPTGVTLVGQDWGGILGLALAAAHDDRFDRLVPANTGLPDGTQTMAEEWHQFATFVEEVDSLPIEMLVGQATLSTLSEAERAAYEAPFHTEAAKAGARALPGLVPTDPDDPGAERMRDTRERLSNWEKPAFVLFSDSDPITGDARDPLRELLPTASDQPDLWIEDAAHFLQEDAGETLAREVVGFVERTEV
jgi:haloalkane dehalogenase